MIKKGPCACWLVCDTNSSGAGVWCAFGINLFSGDYSFSGLRQGLPIYAVGFLHLGLVLQVVSFFCPS
jgi:hypothetical protein